MKDEIKEILEGIEVVIKHDGILEFDAKELKILLDYITNLEQIDKSKEIQIETLEEILNYKDQEIERLNNIINELAKTFVNDDKRIKEYNIEHPERPLDNYSRYYLDKLKELKEGK